VWQRREVSYFSGGPCVRQEPQARAAFHIRLKLPFPHEPHILFCCHASAFINHSKVVQGSMQQPDYSTKTICHERNDLVLYFILSIMHDPMNIRCNQKCMSLRNLGIDFIVWLCRGYA